MSTYRTTYTPLLHHSNDVVAIGKFMVVITSLLTNSGRVWDLITQQEWLHFQKTGKFNV